MNFKLTLSALVIIVFAGMGVTDALNQKHQLKVKNIQLHSKSAEIEQLKVEHQQLNVQLETELKQNQVNTEKVKKLEEEKKRLEERTRQLEARKAEKSRLAKLLGRQTASAQTSARAPVRAPKGNCADWIRQAGITDVANANELIRRESGCNPNAVNRSSGACGVAQELPCGKSGCGMGNGACQVKWMAKYIENRYGSWANAVAFHDRNSWY